MIIKKKPQDPIEEAFKAFDGQSGSHLTRQDWKQSVADNVKKIEAEKFSEVEDGKDAEEKKDAKEENERIKENKEKWRESDRADGLFDKSHPQKIEDKEEAIFADDLKQVLDKEKLTKE